MKLHSLVCQGCGRQFQDRKKRNYCQFACRMKLTEWTEAQVRFHIRRAGSRSAFGELLGVNDSTVGKNLPTRAIDELYRGMMVNIGGILVKRCPCCEVTWPLSKYYTQNLNASGVAGRCESCRVNKRLLESNSETLTEGCT